MHTLTTFFPPLLQPNSSFFFSANIQPTLINVAPLGAGVQPVGRLIAPAHKVFAPVHKAFAPVKEDTGANEWRQGKRRRRSGWFLFIAISEEAEKKANNHRGGLSFVATK